MVAAIIAICVIILEKKVEKQTLNIGKSRWGKDST